MLGKNGGPTIATEVLRAAAMADRVEMVAMMGVVGHETVEPGIRWIESGERAVPLSGRESRFSLIRIRLSFHGL